MVSHFISFVSTVVFAGVDGQSHHYVLLKIVSSRPNEDEKHTKVAFTRGVGSGEEVNLECVAGKARLDNCELESSTLINFISAFKPQGTNAADIATLSGAHTNGKSCCLFYRFPIFSETYTDQNFLASRKACCSRNSGPTDNNLMILDVETPAI
ncbi:hypothetical protein SUGI_0972140 [Cryptomeria japonica]|nr:hypothetical protein SUGI_0972140 [Cryptomeria japonica]